MQQNPKDIIVTVLTLMGYEDDKNSYADEFFQNCEKQAFADAIKGLPERTQEEIKHKVFWIKDQERLKTIIAEYVTPEQYKEALKQASQTAFEGLLKEIIPMLSDDQAAKLQSYLISLPVSPVPEVSITKDNETLTRKHNIRFSWQRTYILPKPETATP